MKKLILASFLVFTIACTQADERSTEIMSDQALHEHTACDSSGLRLQVLGSGGPEIDDGRASSSYLIWLDGKARVLVDAGAGSAVNFEKSGAKFSDLEVILLTHLHVDHSADLPAYLKASFFVKRKNDLLLIGPDENSRMPSTEEFVNRLFKTNMGAYQYLGDYLPDEQGNSQSSTYTLQGLNYSEPLVLKESKIKIEAVSVKHGPIPALAWRIQKDDKSLLFSGDMSSAGSDFIDLLNKVNLFVAHNAIPENAGASAKNLHMTPKQIGEYARAGKVQRLVLSHRMKRTLGNEVDTLSGVKENYTGAVDFAEDFSCFDL